MNSKNCMHEITESAKTVRVVWGVLKDLIDGKFYSEDPDKRRRFETAIESVETGTSRLVRILEKHNKGEAGEKRLMQEVSIEAGSIALEFNVIKRALKSAPPGKQRGRGTAKDRVSDYYQRLSFLHLGSLYCAVPVASLYMAGDCSFTIACHVDSELMLLKITQFQGDFLMVKNFNSWCG